MKCKAYVTGALGLLLVGQAVAAAPAPCSEPAYQAFGFWVGEWTVKTADGTLAGSNTITPEERGCVLVERWRSAQGGTGQSYNYYDPTKDQWHQLWVSPGAIIDIAGGLRDGSMVLEGHIVYSTQGTKHGFRGTWTPMEDGRVRQFFEQQNEEGDWAPWFEGFYSPEAPVDAPEG